MREKSTEEREREGGVGQLERGKGEGKEGGRESGEGGMSGVAGKGRGKGEGKGGRLERWGAGNVGLGYLLFRFRMFPFILFFRFN